VSKGMALDGAFEHDERVPRSKGAGALLLGERRLIEARVGPSAALSTSDGKRRDDVRDGSVPPAKTACGGWSGGLRLLVVRLVRPVSWTGFQPDREGAPPTRRNKDMRSVRLYGRI